MISRYDCITLDAIAIVVITQITYAEPRLLQSFYIINLVKLVM